MLCALKFLLQVSDDFGYTLFTLALKFIKSTIWIHIYTAAFCNHYYWDNSFEIMLPVFILNIVKSTAQPPEKWIK